MYEPHPADARSTCGRCGQSYLLCDGCPCNELSDEELDEILDEADAAKIERYEEELLREPSDWEMDQAQTAWENRFNR